MKYVVRAEEYSALIMQMLENPRLHDGDILLHNLELEAATAIEEAANHCLLRQHFICNSVKAPHIVDDNDTGSPVDNITSTIDFVPGESVALNEVQRHFHTDANSGLIPACKPRPKGGQRAKNLLNSPPPVTVMVGKHTSYCRAKNPNMHAFGVNMLRGHEVLLCGLSPVLFGYYITIGLFWQ